MWGYDMYHEIMKCLEKHGMESGICTTNGATPRKVRMCTSKGIELVLESFPRMLAIHFRHAGSATPLSKDTVIGIANNYGEIYLSREFGGPEFPPGIEQLFENRNAMSITTPITQEGLDKVMLAVRTFATL